MTTPMLFLEPWRALRRNHEPPSRPVRTATGLSYVCFACGWAPAGGINWLCSPTAAASGSRKTECFAGLRNGLAAGLRKLFRSQPASDGCEPMGANVRSVVCRSVTARQWRAIKQGVGPIPARLQESAHRAKHRICFTERYIFASSPQDGLKVSPPCPQSWISARRTDTQAYGEGPQVGGNRGPSTKTIQSNHKNNEWTIRTSTPWPAPS